MFELARMCREAADTIWQLRDDLQRANDAVRDAEHDESRAWDRVRKAESQIAELRELLQDYHRYEHEDCYSCRYINECRADESGRCIAPMRLSERYRELGVPE